MGVYFLQFWKEARAKAPAALAPSNSLDLASCVVCVVGCLTAALCSQVVRADKLL